MTDPWERPKVAETCPATMLHIENSSLNPAREKMFHEHVYTFSAQALGENAFPGKSYPLSPCTPLPATSFLKKPIERTITRRRTRRSFTGKGIRLGKLARILRSAYGITSPASAESNGPAYRACPSAGALYPLEIYPAVFHSQGLQSGIYHYNVRNNSLERLTEQITYEQIDANLLGTELMPGADVALVITAVLDRALSKYGERGYRFALIEVGHLAQNVSLVCEALGLNSVCLGGFYEDGLAELLSIDSRSEPVQYVVLIGTR